MNENENEKTYRSMVLSLILPYLISLVTPCNMTYSMIFRYRTTAISMANFSEKCCEQVNIIYTFQYVINKCEVFFFPGFCIYDNILKHIDPSHC